ncbi:hypothetical protein RFI_18169, partial [Reticulomyxa filosa]
EEEEEDEATEETTTIDRQRNSIKRSASQKNKDKRKRKSKKKRKSEWLTSQKIDASKKKEFTIKYLNYSSSYQIRVRGYNHFGWSKFSAPILANTSSLGLLIYTYIFFFLRIRNRYICICMYIVLGFKSHGPISENIKISENKKYVKYQNETGKVICDYEVDLRTINDKYFIWEIVCWKIGVHGTSIGFLKGSLKKYRHSYNWNAPLGSTSNEFALSFTLNSKYLHYYPNGPFKKKRQTFYFINLFFCI